MYNLFVTANSEAWNGTPEVFGLSRCLREYTDEKLKQEFSNLSDDSIAQLRQYPCLFAYEGGCNLPARVGHIAQIKTRGREARIEYLLDSGIPPVSVEAMDKLKWDLEIDNLEMNRTHWALKKPDLYAVLLGSSSEGTATRDVSSTVSVDVKASDVPPRENAPKVFVSYSHDSQEHKEWVLDLSTRLVENGVDVILDQWDLRLGGDLPSFMESGLTQADRILAICTGAYVTKADGGQGGVGYEKMILTAQLMQDVRRNSIIPVVRHNDAEQALPTFLSSRLYIDFRDDSLFEEKYEELLREIHGERTAQRPPLGPNPFRRVPAFSSPRLPRSPERYISPELSGTVSFDYSNNNGRYVIGTGDMAFETKWSSASNSSIHAYNDPPSVVTVALASGAKSISEIDDASAYDTSSRTRTPRLGEIVVWQNSAGYFAATQIETVKSRSHGCPNDEVTFSYRIQANRTACFTEEPN